MKSIFNNKRYELGDAIGQGSFGWVYKAFDNQTKQFVAIKFEKPCNLSQASKEIEVLTELRGEHGFPNILNSGIHGDYSYIVMTLFTHTLYEKARHIRKRMGVDAVIKVGIQCLERIYTLHNKTYLHRDLKPQQYLIDEDLNVTLIDFGLCKKYTYGNRMMHIPYKDNQGFLGNLNYCSLNTLCGIEQSRRDDLESFCYILVFLLSGTLPWVSKDKKKKKKKKTSIEAIKESKMRLTPRNLFESPFLQEMFLYVKGLEFDRTPDYIYLFALLTKVMSQGKALFSGSTLDTQRHINENHNLGMSKEKSKKKKPVKRNKRKRCNSLGTPLTMSISNSITMITEFPEIMNRDILFNRIFDTELPKNEIIKIQEKSNCVII